MKQTWKTELVLEISLVGFIFFLLERILLLLFLVLQFMWSFCAGLFSKKLWEFLLLFSPGFTSFGILLLFLNQSPSSFLCSVFITVSLSINEVLSINPSANVFVYGDFNINHKEWLTFSSGSYRPSGLSYNFCTSNDLTQMVNFLIRIPRCDSDRPILLFFFFVLTV